MENNRTTFLIGAGTPLDLDLPQGVIKASTSNITDDVRKLTQIILFKVRQ